MRREWQPGEWGGVIPIDHLLSFTESGDGDLHCFPVTADGVRSHVFRWDHEDDSRRARDARMRSMCGGAG